MISAEDVIKLVCTHGLWQVLQEQYLVFFWLRIIHKHCLSKRLQTLIHEANRCMELITHLHRLSLNYWCTSLLSELQKFIDNLSSRLNFTNLCLFLVNELTLFYKCFIKCSFKFRNEIRIPLRKVESQWLAVKHIASEGFDHCFCSLFISCDNESLASKLYVLLCVDFMHLTIIAEQLEQRVFNVCNLYLFVKVLDIHSR